MQDCQCRTLLLPRTDQFACCVETRKPASRTFCCLSPCKLRAKGGSHRANPVDALIAPGRGSFRCESPFLPRCGAALHQCGSRPDGRTVQVDAVRAAGGLPAIGAVVDDFVGNVAGDRRINRSFANTNIQRLKFLLVQQICQASGGPCIYAGEEKSSRASGRCC
jgi:hypothetical protein